MQHAILIILFRKGNVHAAAQNIPFSRLIFPLPASLRHLRSEKVSDFRCQSAADSQLSNYILYQTLAKCNYLFSICGYGIYYSECFCLLFPHRNVCSASAVP